MTNSKYELTAVDEFAKKVAEIDRRGKASEFDHILDRLEFLKKIKIGDEVGSSFAQEFSTGLETLANDFHVLENEGGSRYSKAAYNFTLSALEERIDVYQSRFHDRAEIVGILRAEADRLGETPTARYLRDEGITCQEVLRTHFGSETRSGELSENVLNNALWAAGLEFNQYEYGQEEIAHEARGIIYEEDSEFSRSQLHEGEPKVTKGKIRRNFESTEHFLEYSGLDTYDTVRKKMMRNRYDEDGYIDESATLPDITEEIDLADPSPSVSSLLSDD